MGWLDVVMDYGGQVVEKAIDVGGEYIAGEVKAKQNKDVAKALKNRAVKGNGGAPSAPGTALVPTLPAGQTLPEMYEQASSDYGVIPAGVSKTGGLATRAAALVGPPAPGAAGEGGWMIKNNKLCIVGAARTIQPCYRARTIMTPGGLAVVRASRRMNPLNFRALKRSTHRVSAFAKIARKCISFTKSKSMPKFRKRKRVCK